MSDEDKYVANRKIIWKVNNITSEKLKYLNFYSNSISFHFSTKTSWAFLLRGYENKLGFFFVRNFPEGKGIEDEDEFDVKLDLEIRGVDGQVLEKRAFSRKSYEFTVKTADWGWKNICEYAKIFSDTNYLSDGNTLTFFIDVTLEQTQKELKKRDLHPLLLNYSKHFNNSNLSDFIITSSDNRKFYAHRVILASQSSFFDKLFAGEPLDNNKLRNMSIPDADSVTLQELLRFMYTGQVEKIDEYARDLLYVAHKYNVKELKQQCISILVQKIKFSNIFDILSLAEKCSAQRLIYECLQFIVKNYLNIITHKDWKKLGLDMMIQIIDAMGQEGGNEKILFGSL
ncbi:hypothetical protein PVAND_001221 [Polypedilum vanderplanki]|uniref:BTB domain-containing protein n=1 Tax=Polypedilum vanderplanki TaxID=319348 RepID=A0A9J6BMA2_POLVA|nr:hypothetical protein PVAND_001221 [Polypedilum vanderplanki]